ncbi:succinate dehydrogenase, cytochrome b556 subunit [Marinomonas mediterranea]|jgi:succinate dehydrogenase subunit C (EC 1.3.5.1)|uniref:Succinate dehydrogenase cytochrome b556 subunit n=1 Tax=Marinomonas mediterranea (strain ATCC 700492 / JCM 21426 / NBRC 103028 / MMB-1) TaxID=717774 RepID=F2JWZ9_MARM1|nr:succinate dehydrogenase, cytochrome b556 subunit [Marinomonas mediterranea]ADZ89518.1 succinate dehydrogenase, cytochrome b556 subunit [Marinomonas mediterranea MMB-1]WCN15763.1 succinate dehydrogenase, cytochrome b556 subunit [Marinomonas mediterranea MMB-1]
MSKARPVNLDIKTIRLPITAIASILHRISAVILWVGFGVFLVNAYFSLNSKDGFGYVSSLLADYFVIQFVIWGMLTALGYYMVATLKHLVQDMGYFEELESGKMIANVAIAIGILLSLCTGVWVWL